MGVTKTPATLQVALGSERAAGSWGEREKGPGTPNVITFSPHNPGCPVVDLEGVKWRLDFDVKAVDSSGGWCLSRPWLGHLSLSVRLSSPAR